MLVRVTIDFRSRRLKNSRANPFGQAEHVDGSDYVGFDSLYRVVLVMDGRSRASQIIDLVNLEKDRLNYIMAQQFKAMVIEQMSDVFAPSGKEIVQADYLVLICQQLLAQMRTNESRAAGNEYSHLIANPLHHRELIDPSRH